MSGSPMDTLIGGDAVLAPLPGASPTGPSLRYDPVYDAIREARRQDDPNLPQGIWQTTAKRADWDLVIRLCREVLETRSKDIQVACWMVEAMTCRHGFAALAPSLNLVAGLCATFWDGLHPEIDEDGDLSARIAPLEWLNDKLPKLLHTLPLTWSGSQTVEAYSYADYENAQRRHMAAARDPRGASLAKGEVALADIEESAGDTPIAFHRALYAQLAAAAEAIDSLSALLDERCGRHAPGLASLRNTCIGLQGWVNTVLCAKGEDAEMAIPALGDEENPGFYHGGEPDGFAQDGFAPHHPEAFQPYQSDGVIHTREEAFFWLAQVTEFLMRTEPHSPIPYVMQRALGWANRPLHEILLEVSRGRNDLAAVFDFLGYNFSEMSQQQDGRRDK